MPLLPAMQLQTLHVQVICLVSTFGQYNSLESDVRIKQINTEEP